MNNIPEITIYSMPSCAFCQLAKAYFRKRGIKYTDIDVSKNEQAAQEMVEISGQTSTPVIQIGDTIVLGYAKDTFDSLLS